MKYLIRLVLVLLFIPVMTIWAMLGLICLMTSAIQIPIYFIINGNVYIEDLAMDWFFEHGLDLVVNIEYKLKENHWI